MPPCRPHEDVQVRHADFVKIQTGGEVAATLGGDSLAILRQHPPVESIEEIQISGQTIRLGQLLKLSGLAQSGGESKQLLAAGVLVNGVAETRRGRQLRDGDLVEAAGASTRIVLRSRGSGATGP